MTDLLVKILVVVIFLGGGWMLVGYIDGIKDERDAAVADRKALVENNELNAKLVDAFNDRQAKLKPITNTIIREIEKERPHVPVSCSPALDPVFDAIRGLQQVDRTR